MARDEAAQLTLMSCWILGDKYGIPEFQDLIMLELLARFEQQNIHVSAAKLAFEYTPPGSLLRELVAEELGWRFGCAGNSGLSFEELDKFDQIPGVMSVIIRKTHQRNKNGKFTPRVPSQHKPHDGLQGQSPYWNFMLGGKRPKSHWLNERIEKANGKASLWR
ncbi:hypothetical protein LTR56_022123 [Elasticomyces elasticus]|nr:hypothetical protein LTR56_022123 [Elasticomyces elasticus]KAK3642013.1 hypothetical protein LTR22_016338 [Elasticomyces elasticus]KAK4910636.1 hypothetical protein LTR49_020671 [Elasticomyces elasticus]KAK5748857.1 hypothetical protein LTS12_021095 [Elasticomyces elasticus]